MSPGARGGPRLRSSFPARSAHLTADQREIPRSHFLPPLLHMLLSCIGAGRRFFETGNGGEGCRASRAWPEPGVPCPELGCRSWPRGAFTAAWIQMEWLCVPRCKTEAGEPPPAPFPPAPATPQGPRERSRCVASRGTKTGGCAGNRVPRAPRACVLQMPEQGLP